MRFQWVIHFRVFQVCLGLQARQSCRTKFWTKSLKKRSLNGFNSCAMKFLHTVQFQIERRQSLKLSTFDLANRRLIQNQTVKVFVLGTSHFQKEILKKVAFSSQPSSRKLSNENRFWRANFDKLRENFREVISRKNVQHELQHIPTYVSSLYR